MIDKSAATAKGRITRKTNQLAGPRMALPGHHHLREELLRAELIADFAPANRIEAIWVGDIAYCMAAIEHKRAQIAALHHLALRKTYQAISAPEPLHIPGDKVTPPRFDEAAYPSQLRAEMDDYAASGFRARVPGTLLESEAFASLLGSLAARDMAVLRMLRQDLDLQTRERDRIINQIDRRRREAMRAAIERSEAHRRARAAGEPDAGGCGIAIEGAVPEHGFHDLDLIIAGNESEADEAGEPMDGASTDDLKAAARAPYGSDPALERGA